MRAVGALLVAAAGVASGADLQPISSAERCGDCHRAIHEAWKQSAHARSMESRLFQDALELAETDFGAAAARSCLNCHAPLAVQLGDFALQRKVSWEGVSCDYCHSLRKVAFAGPAPKAQFEFSLVKSGPLRGADPGVHGAVYSDVHISSLVCAPCHEYQNAERFPLLTTYSEWKNSRHGKEGVQCQSCHMSRVAGLVVEPRLKRASDAKVNLHQMPGSHSLEQLNRTINTRLLTQRNGDRLEVTVEIANATAGHYVPTGSPLRQLILELRADAGEDRRYREERVYRRVVADKAGKPVEHEHVAFMRAVKVVADTRLAPDEKRLEKFSFEVPAETPAQVAATLSYYYSPTARAESQRKVTFRTVKRLVR